MATAQDLTTAKNNALGTTSSVSPLRTFYGSGADLANGKSVYGNTVNYGDINNPNLKAGDIVAGGSAVTPTITDDMISKAGASRLYGNTANDTLAQMQTNSKTTLPQYYQNTNNQALANTNYDKLSLPNISGSYADRINNSLANTNTAMYQGQVQDVLDNYNNAYTVDPTDSATFKNDMTNSIGNLYDTQRNNVPLYYQTGIDQAKQQYAGLRNQASVTDQQSLNKLKEAMAQQGLFNSGDNITAQTGINNQYANDLSGYNKQEQNYYDTTNNAIAQQKAQYDAQQAQALIDLGYKADTRDFSLADLYDTRKQSTFNNSMTGVNSRYGMSQDEFNNTLKAVSQLYSMDQDQVNNNLNYANFNSNQDQRRFGNTTSVNKSNSDLTQAQTDNSYRQEQADTTNRQAQQQIDNQASQWLQQFNYQKEQDAIANSLAQARLSASGGGGGGGGRGSSGRSGYGSSGSSSSSSANDFQAQADFNSASVQTQYGLLNNPDFVNNVSSSTIKKLQTAYLKNLEDSGLGQDLVSGSQPTWNYQAAPQRSYAETR